jgi:hypothetical protein
MHQSARGSPVRMMHTVDIIWRFGQLACLRVCVCVEREGGERERKGGGRRDRTDGRRERMGEREREQLSCLLAPADIRATRISLSIR